MKIITLLTCILSVTGNYLNPILHSDYSDPDVISVDGEFWIFWGDPDLGIFQIHTDHPAGRIYLVHAWAGSRAGFFATTAVKRNNGGSVEIY